jgi:hypothetical protein
VADKPAKTASSEAAWALLMEGVTSARVETHRLKILINRCEALVKDSTHRDHLYQVAGDIIVDMPVKLQRLETVLDRTALALSGMGEDFLSARLPLHEKNLVEEATSPAAFGGNQPRSSVERVAQEYMRRKVGQEARTAYLTDPEVVGEVLTVRVDGRSLSDHIENFLKVLITQGRGLNKLVEQAQTTVEGYNGGEQVDTRRLSQVIQAFLEKGRWGQDAMSKPLADLIALGEYIW